MAHQTIAELIAQVQCCGRVVTTAALRNSKNDASGRNRIGRSMDDNASTDEPWWKVSFDMQKLQVRETHA